MREHLRGLRPDHRALGAIVLAVLLANLPYLLGLFHPNPLSFRGGLTSAVTPGLLEGRPTIDPSNGFTSQAIGHLAALDLLHLRLPWWNPYEATGMPLLGETQSAALFPPTLLTAFGNGQLYEHILLELIGGICTYRLLRRLELSRPAAVAAGIAFALNGKFAWFADAGVNPLPFLPMLLLGIERAYTATREGRRGGWRLLALAGALSVYAGFPEVAYADALMGVAWFGWRCGCLERARLLALLSKVALGALAGTLLAAPVLIAMGTYLVNADLGIHANGHLGGAHLRPAALAQLLLPYVYGQINADPHATTWIGVGGYLTTSLMLLAAIGLLAPGRRGLKLVLLGWGLLVFARIYGEPPLLGHVIGLLPDMSRIQFFRYATATLELPVIVLAALGLDALGRGELPRRRLGWGAVAAMLVVLAAALGARSAVHRLGSAFHHGTYLHLAVLWGALLLAAVAAAAIVRDARRRTTLLVVLVAVDALVLFAVPEFAAPRATTVDLTPVRYLRAHLGDARFYTLGPISPDYGSYFALASVAIDDFPPRSYADFARTRLDPGVAFTGFRSKAVPSAESELLTHLEGYRYAAVRFILTPARTALPERRGGLRLVFRSPTTRIYRLTGTSPYFAAPGCRVSPEGRDRARVACLHQTTLVRRETQLPGWSAELDGRPVSTRRVGGLFQGVSLPPGTHSVRFSFAPPGIGWALLALLGGFTLMLVPTLRGSRGGVRAVLGSAYPRLR